jgi:hypothetical protein
MVAHVEISQRHAQTVELPLWSDEGIASLRDGAKLLHYPLNRIRLSQADAMVAERALHVARTAMTTARTETAHSAARDQAATAELKRSDALGRMYDELDRAADSFLSMLSIAIDRRPNEVAAMLTPFLAKLFGSTWDSLTVRIDTLETALAAELEAAR